MMILPHEMLDMVHISTKAIRTNGQDNIVIKHHANAIALNSVNTDMHDAIAWPDARWWSKQKKTIIIVTINQVQHILSCFPNGLILQVCTHSLVKTALASLYVR